MLLLPAAADCATHAQTVPRTRTSAVLLLLAVLSVGDAAAAEPAAAAAAKPNIVFVVVDDMGYHNIRAPPLHTTSEAF